MQERRKRVRLGARGLRPPSLQRSCWEPRGCLSCVELSCAEGLRGLVSSGRTGEKLQWEDCSVCPAPMSHVEKLFEILSLASLKT